MPDGDVTELIVEETSDVVTTNVEETPDVVNATGNKKSDIATTKKFTFILNDNDFNSLVEKAFSSVKNDEILCYKFPHTLTENQRKIIHERAETLNLVTKSQENRFRVLYLSKIVDDIKSSSQPTLRNKIGLELQAATNIPLPRSQVIDEVLNSQNQIQSIGEIECEVCHKIGFKKGTSIRMHIMKAHPDKYKEMKQDGLL